MLEQCCNYSKQCRNNVATLCCAKNRPCESSRVTSPQSSLISIQTQTSLVVSLRRGSPIWIFHLSLTRLSTSCLGLLFHESTFHFHAILNASPSKLGHFCITGTGAWSLSCNGSGHLGTHRWRGWNGDRDSGRAMTLYTWEQNNEMMLAILQVEYNTPAVEYNTVMTLQPIKFHIQISITI